MTYEEFQEYVRAKCMYETIYTDSDGREILVIKLLNAYGMVNRAQRKWVGLTPEHLADCILKSRGNEVTTWKLIESKLKELNT